MRQIKFDVAFALLIVAVCISSIAAQSKKAKPKPLATPPVLTGAEIISQAGEDAEPVPTPAPTATRAITNAERIRDLNERIKKLEAGQHPTYEDRQKRLLMNLDILTRSEQRTETLRKQLFEMIEKENSINTRLDQIDYDIRPEIIERSVQLAGSLRPEEIREARRKGLAAERANLQSLLTQVQATRSGLEASLQKAEAMVEKLRARAEKDIEDSLQEPDEQPAVKDQQ